MSSSVDAIRKQILNDVKSAMNEAQSKTQIALDNNLLGYYAGGEPKVYERTATLIDASNVTPVTCGSDTFTYKAELDGSRISYSTGTFSGHQVIGATETGGFGNTVGEHGYWKKTQEEIPNIVDSALSKRF